MKIDATKGTPQKRAYDLSGGAISHIENVLLQLQYLENIDRYMLGKYDIRASDVKQLNRLKKNLELLHEDMTFGKYNFK